MSKRTVIFPPDWSAMPGDIDELLTRLNPLELRLYIRLLRLSRGFVKEIEADNVDLMTTAKLDRNSLPSARGGLVDKGVITARPVFRRERYVYRLLLPWRPPDEAEQSDSITVDGVTVTTTIRPLDLTPIFDAAQHAKGFDADGKRIETHESMSVKTED
jgi:hypothetical protein